MTKKNTMALFLTVVCAFLSSFGCGSNEEDVPGCTGRGNCVVEPVTTGSVVTEPQTTGGTTGTTTATQTVTATTTSTATATATATNAPITIPLSDGSYCTIRTDSRDSATGGPLDLSGTWKVTIIANGEELLLKANVDAYGLTNTCGIPAGVASPTPTHWRGVSTEKCIAWVPDSYGSLGSNAPWIQGTGTATDATGTTCIIGGNPAIKICRILQIIPGCP